MDEQTARILVQSLLERLEADARRDAPQYLAAVSHLERSALRYLLRAGGDTVLSTIPSLRNAEQSEVKQDDEGHPADTGIDKVAGPIQTDSGPAEHDPESNPPQAVISTVEVNPLGNGQALAIGPRQEAPRLDETAVSLSATQDAACVLCLDFGTAKSKAFAATVNGEDDLDPHLIELGLGKRDGDLNAIYTVSSSLWVSDDGLLYVGSEALRKSLDALVSGAPRRRLDSIKQQLTLVAYEQDLAARRLEAELNPTTVPLSYEDAICLFLAYLTDLAVTELGTSGRSRYVKRRFTIPCWPPAQRSWAASALAKYTVRAQMLADTFHGKWHSGIPAEHWKGAVAAASAYDAQLKYLLDHATGAQGILEPLAAGSGRVWADSATKNLVFVLDVGAGTTDFSLFWVVQNIGVAPPRKAFQVAPYSDAIRMAGDFVDERLLVQLVARAHGASDDLVRKRIETDLRLRGLRTLKERLFTTGEVRVTLVTDQTVSISLDEFLANDQVKGVGLEIERAVERFLNSVHVSWSAVAENAQIVLTGGGANMPNIKALADRAWELGGKRLRFRRAADVPEFIATNFDANFQREYPQLAVAIGGVLPVLDEKSRLEEYMGSAIKPGPLTTYQVTGV